MTDPLLDDDALTAGLDLIGRTGARGLEIGYLHDDVPADQASWYASAQYQGARITEEDHRGPVEAVEALARRLLQGGKCNHCHRLVTLSDRSAIAFDGRLADGTRWTVEQARAAGTCRWRRVGPRWERGCERPAAPPPAGRKKRRRAKGRKKRG